MVAEELIRTQSSCSQFADRLEPASRFLGLFPALESGCSEVLGEEELEVDELLEVVVLEVVSLESPRSGSEEVGPSRSFVSSLVEGSFSVRGSCVLSGSAFPGSDVV